MQKHSHSLKQLQVEIHIWINSFNIENNKQAERPTKGDLNRFNQIKNVKRKQQFLAGRATLREVLSNYHQIPANKWKFEYGPHGKPFLSFEHLLPPLQFNISHTSQVVVCALSMMRPIGVDIEHQQRADQSSALNRICLPQELQLLKDTNVFHKKTILWTLKEAYSKAYGKPLLSACKQISFDFSEAPILKYKLQNQKNIKEKWDFRVYNTKSNHIISLAFSRYADKDKPLIRIFDIKNKKTNSMNAILSNDLSADVAEQNIAAKIDRNLY